MGTYLDRLIRAAIDLALACGLIMAMLANESPIHLVKYARRIRSVIQPLSALQHFERLRGNL